MIDATKDFFGWSNDNEAIYQYTLSNGALSVSLMDLGASVQRIVFHGADMVLSFPDPFLYLLLSRECFGATVGRYSGMIAGGRFQIDGKEYGLSLNHEGSHMHGGFNGFATKLWKGGICEDRNGKFVQFTLFSPDGEEGYPGNLQVRVVYRITPDNRLIMAYDAESDQDTIINLTNHCYFNPNGFPAFQQEQVQAFQGDNRYVEMTIASDKIVELEGQLPTGRFSPVDGTKFDFRHPTTLEKCGEEESGDKDGCYDNTFVFSNHAPDQAVARAKGLKSGISIEWFTDQPGAQLFTMGSKQGFLFLMSLRPDMPIPEEDEPESESELELNEPRNSFAFETQHFPDSPNQPHFPGTVLRAGEKFHSETTLYFSKE